MIDVRFCVGDSHDAYHFLIFAKGLFYDVPDASENICWFSTNDANAKTPLLFQSNGVEFWSE